jgi:hypothetical protein
LLRVLLLEKVVQHVVVTGALATGRFGVGDDLAVDAGLLAIIGGLAAALYAIALAGHLAGRRWSLWLAVVLGAVDVVGEFAAQGGLTIVVTVSFIVALAVIVLAARELIHGAPVEPSGQRADR